MKSKPLLFFACAALAVIGLTFYSIISITPKELVFSSTDILAFRKAKNQLIRSQVNAPFYQDTAFDSLRYFSPNSSEVFTSEFFKINDGQTLDLMPDRTGYPSHVVKGFALLEKDTWRDTLYILKDLEEQSDTLFFVPFSDETNGKETYGGGRYLDVVLKPGKPVRIDFNYAYNPYCAYNAAYICPKSPVLNRLSKRIEAGEKTY